MRKLLTPRRSLLGASTFLLAASSLALLTPADASAARRVDPIVREQYFSDASLTTQVGGCVYNIKCNGLTQCWGTMTEYVVETVSQCPLH
jgi:hypothetical protein